MLSIKEFKPEAYWEKRLRNRFSLEGVGNRSFRLEYNIWLYRARVRVLGKLLRDNQLNLRDKTLLDIGAGTGYYLEFFKRRGIGRVTGMDITSASVEALKKRHPEDHFVKASVADRDLPISGKFEVITAFDVLFHIVDESDFRQAIRNIGNFCHDNSIVLIIDSFLKEMKPYGQHVHHRTLESFREALEENELEIREIKPIFFFMNDPIDLERIGNRCFRSLLGIMWWVNLKVTGALWKLGRSGKVMTNVWAWGLYNLDRLMLRHIEVGPSTKLMLVEPRKKTDNMRRSPEPSS